MFFNYMWAVDNTLLIKGVDEHEHEQTDKELYS